RATVPPTLPGCARARAAATTAPDARTSPISTVVDRSSRSPPPAANAAAVKAAPRSALAANEPKRGTDQRRQVAPCGGGPARCAAATTPARTATVWPAARARAAAAARDRGRDHAVAVRVLLDVRGEVVARLLELAVAVMAVELPVLGAVAYDLVVVGDGRRG